MDRIVALRENEGMFAGRALGLLKIECSFLGQYPASKKGTACKANRSKELLPVNPS